MYGKHTLTQNAHEGTAVATGTNESLVSPTLKKRKGASTNENYEEARHGFLWKTKNETLGQNGNLWFIIVVTHNLK